MKFKSLFGFTLNEVLISVAIIGIIAAVTIPTVVKNHRKKTEVLALQKVYVELTNNLGVLQAENYLKKGLYNSVLARVQVPLKEANIEAFFSEYYKLSQTCGNVAQPCFATEYSSINSADTEEFNCNSGYSAILSNGASMCITEGSLSRRVLIGGPIQIVKRPATVYIDINGADEPNIGGRDMFTFNIYEDFSIDEIDPTTGTLNTIVQEREDLFEENCLSSPIGTGCFAKILNDNWKMNY